MADDDQFLGEIRVFGGQVAPSGWAFCNGQLLSIGDNISLYNLIGTTYGGDGIMTFALPDLRGRVPIHTGNSYSLGQAGGLEQVTLQPDNLPQHSHAVTATNQGGSDSPKSAAWGKATANVYATTWGNMLPMSTAGISTTGMGNAHDNMIPFLVVSYIIALAGVYPPAGLAE